MLEQPRPIVKQEMKRHNKPVVRPSEAHKDAGNADRIGQSLTLLSNLEQ
jgi:hypothetical protein